MQECRSEQNTYGITHHRGHPGCQQRKRQQAGNKHAQRAADDRRTGYPDQYDVNGWHFCNSVALLIKKNGLSSVLVAAACPRLVWRRTAVRAQAFHRQLDSFLPKSRRKLHCRSGFNRFQT
jgi:hypothetical protein